MPIALSPKTQPKNGLTKFTNCRLLRGDRLVNDDLWVSSVTGKIIHSQASFYDELVLPDKTVDLGGRIIAPGMIECQLNGAFGFNFSTLLQDMSQYGKKVRGVNRLLIETGVTSYIPTITSQRAELYQKVSLASLTSGISADSVGSPIPWTIRKTTPCRGRRRVAGSPLRRPVPEPYQEWRTQRRRAPQG